MQIDYKDIVLDQSLDTDETVRRNQCSIWDITEQTRLYYMGEYETAILENILALL